MQVNSSKLEPHNVFTCRQTHSCHHDDLMSFSSARRSSSLSPSTHLCPPEDIFHSWVPRLCPPCSSRLSGWDGRAVRVRSPWTQTLYESTDPAQLEAQHLTEEITRFLFGKENPSLEWKFDIIQVSSEKQRRRKPCTRTNTSVSVQHQPSLAGTFEAA